MISIIIRIFVHLATYPMRNFSALIALIASLFIIIVSCQQAPFITINGSRSLSFSKDGGTQSISFSINRDWSIVSSESWCKAASTSGKAETGTVTVSVICEPNQNYDARSCTLTIRIDDLSETITVSQDSKLGLIVDKKAVELTNSAQSFEIKLQKNVQYTVMIDDAGAGWITYTGTKALVSEVATFSVTANGDYDPREGRITFKQANGNISETVIVRQGEANGLFVTRPEYNLSNQACTLNIEVKANVEFEVTSQADWITYVETKALNSSTMTLSIEANDSYDSRVGTVKVKQTNGNLTGTVTIHQGETNGLFITTPEYELSNDEHTLSVEVKANVEFEVTSQADWITYVETKSLHTSTITLHIASNDTYDQRTGTVKVKQTNGDLSGTITVTQKQTDGLLVTPSSFDLSNEAQNVELTVDHNVPVSVIIPEDAKSWISQVTSSSTKAMETSKVALSIATNTTSETRSAVITIKQTNGNLAETVDIKQQSKPAAFSDKAFYAYLLSNFDKDGNGYITQDEAVEVTSIVVDSDDIENMSGIEVFENLVELSAVPKHTSSYGVGIGEDWRNTGYTLEEYNGYNTVKIVIGKLSSLDVSKNTKLTKLDCSGNVLTSIDLSSNHNLEIVNLSCNYDLNNVNLAGCSSLRELNLQATSVTSIDLSKCPNLETLYFDRGKEVASGTLDLSNNSKLSGLFIDYRGFTHLDLSHNSELTQLSCAMNQLTELNISKNPKLISVTSGYNQVQSIDLTANSEIEYLMFQNNCLKTIDLSNLTHLRSVHIGNYVNDGIRAVNSISEVDLSHNPELRDLFTTISDIKILDVSDKTKLEQFDCSFNNLVEEIDISNSPNLRSLNCYGAPSLAKIYVNPEQSFTYSKDNTAHFYYKGDGAPYTSSDYSQDGIVTTLQSASEGNGINIVLMGDAFTDRLIADGTYETIMSETMEAFFSIEPYKSFRNRFNVYSVTAVSPNETYNGTHETAFSTRFGSGSAIYGDDGTVFNYATKVPGFDPDNGLICVVLNEKVYAGTCSMYANYTVDGEGNVVVINKDASGAAIAYIPLGTDSEMFSQLVHHEAGGHGFAKLADEYFYSGSGTISQAASDELSVLHGAGWYTNVDTASDVESVLWAPFIQDTRYTSEKIGLYEGAYLYESGVYRPTEDGVMNTNQGQFNAPSRMTIYSRINKLANGESWMLNYEDFVNYDAVNRTPNMNTKKLNGQNKRAFVPLHEPVVHKGGWRDVTPSPRRLTGEPSVKSSHLREMSVRRQKRSQVSFGAVSPNYATHDGTYLDGSTSK